MITRSLLTFALTLCSAATLLPSVASAQTPLNRATIQNLRNSVDLTVKQQTRPARKADIMTPGDALRTYRQAMAELRFNDNSLARLGEQALFQFTPNSRNFDLRQGTVLLFITPGQGRTRVRTPNAAAGIRGSALFVRYIPDSKVTLIGALTNSDIEVSNGDVCNNSQSVALKAGQLGYVFNCQIGVYNFNLKKFQETSPLFKEANLEQNPEVRTEISQALAEQGTFVGTSESNPDWTKIAENRQPSSDASRPNPSNLASTFERPAVEVNQIKPEIKEPVVVSGPNSRPSEPIVTIVQPPQAANRPGPTVTPPTPVAPSPVTSPVTPPPERPLPQVEVTPPPVVTPVAPPSPPVNTVTTPPATPPTTPTVPTPPPTVATPSTPPVTPATPAVPNPGNGPATPAVPASPATGTPPTVAPSPTPTVVTSPPVSAPVAPVATPPATTPVATTPAAPPVVDLPAIQPAPAPPAATPTTPTPETAPPANGAGGQTPANSNRPVPIAQPPAQ